MKHVLLSALLMPALCLVSPIASAVAQSSQVTGTVSDNRSVLPGATVKVEQTGLTTTTDFEGRFTLPKMAPGKYQITVTF